MYFKKIFLISISIILFSELMFFNSKIMHNVKIEKSNGKVISVFKVDERIDIHFDTKELKHNIKYIMYQTSLFYNSLNSNNHLTQFRDLYISLFNPFKNSINILRNSLSY